MMNRKEVNTFVLVLSSKPPPRRTRGSFCSENLSANLPLIKQTSSLIFLLRFRRCDLYHSHSCLETRRHLSVSLDVRTYSSILCAITSTQRFRTGEQILQLADIIEVRIRTNSRKRYVDFPRPDSITINQRSYCMRSDAKKCAVVVPRKNSRRRHGS